MSCSIVQNPQTPQTIQKPQNSHYSKYTIRFAAGALATGALVGSALAINSFMTETPSLFSNLVNTETLKSVLKTIGAPAIGGLSGAVISSTFSYYIVRQFCLGRDPNDTLDKCVIVGITLFSAISGAAAGSSALTASRLLPV